MGELSSELAVNTYAVLETEMVLKICNNESDSESGVFVLCNLRMTLLKEVIPAKGMNHSGSHEWKFPATNGRIWPIISRAVEIIRNS
jgi:hypothetical protein